MAFLDNTSLHKKRSVGMKEIIWIIIFILLGFFMFYTLFREMKNDRDFQKHLNKEHHHS